MTKTEFIKIKKEAHKPQFRELIGLEKSDNEEFLREFVKMAHPAGGISVKGGLAEYYGKRKYFNYTLYKTCIVRCDTETGEKLLYKI